MRRNLSLFVIIGALFLIASAGASAQTETPSETGTTASALPLKPVKIKEFTLQDIQGYWREGMLLLARGDYDGAYRALNLVAQIKLQNGIRNLPNHSVSLVRKSREAIRQQKYEEAYRLAQIAVKLSPDFSFTHMALAEARKAQHGGIRGIIEYFNIYLDAIEAVFNNFYQELNFFVNAATILIFALFTAFTGFIIIVLLKYFWLLKHNLTHFIQGKMPSGLITILLIIVLLLPVFFNLGIFWMLIFWSFLVAGYMTKKERILVLLFYVSLLSMPPYLHLLFSASLAAYDSPLDAIVQVNETKTDDLAERILLKWRAQEPKNGDISFSLARTYRMQGKNELAERFYRELLDLQQFPALSYNNLGNIYFYRGKLNEAMEFYRQAIRADANLAAPHFNLGQGYNNQFRFKDGEVKFQSALRLNRPLFSYYNDLNHESEIQIQIDGIIPNDKLRDYLFQNSTDKDSLKEQFFLGFMKIIPIVYLIYFVPVLAVLFIYVFFFGRYDWARACINCGKPVCQKCMPTSMQSDYCLPCYRIYEEKMEIDPHIKIEKRKQISDYKSRQVWLTLIGNLLLPGSGSFYQGKTFIGFIFMFLFALFAYQLIFWKGVIISLTDLKEIKTSALMTIDIIIMVGIYILNVWIGQRHISKDPTLNKG